MNDSSNMSQGAEEFQRLTTKYRYLALAARSAVGPKEDRILTELRKYREKKGCTAPDELLADAAKHVLSPGAPEEGEKKKKPRKKPIPIDLTGVSLPIITVSNRHGDELVNEIVDAVVKWNDPPRLFRRAEGVALAYKDEENRPALRSQTPARFLETAVKVARYVRYTAGGDGPFGVMPGSEHAGVVLERLITGQGLPPLLGLADAPRMRPDGSILNQSGYDAATGLYACFEPLDLHVPERPTSEEVAAARDMILELYINFPFLRQSDRAHAIAALITIPLRAMFDLAPLFAYDAPKAGTGKSLIARTTVMVGRGVAPPPTPMPGSEEERRKLITALLRGGAPVVWFDNIGSKLASDALCTALTETKWSDRILGVSESPSIEHQTTWLLTANNVQFNDEMIRRTVHIRLDAREINPESRTGFKHELPSWAVENRASLISSIFILARHWIAEGRPKQIFGGEALGSFDGWVHTIGGILEAAKIYGFLDDRAEQRTTLDDTQSEWAAFFEALGAEMGEAFVMRDVAKEIRNGGPLREALPEDAGHPDDREFAKRLGSQIRERRDRYFTLPGGKMVTIRRAGTAKGGVVRWAVEISDAK